MRKTLASVLRKTSSRSRPWQIAMGVALGITAGSVVHSPLLMIACITIAFWMPIHAAAFAAATALAATLVTMVAPQLGALGEWSLQHPSLLGFWQRLESLPLVPWLGLQNTVINGACIVGLLAAIPLAVVSLFAARWIMASEQVGELALSEAEEDSFVELSATELEQLDRLSGASIVSQESAAEPSQALSDEHLRIDIAAIGVPRPSFPVRNFEVDSVDEPALASSALPVRDAADFEVPDFTAMDEALEHAAAHETKQGIGKPSSIYAFDAVARLEELLSGCRVQPHWSNRNRPESQEHREASESGRADGPIMRVDDEHVSEEDALAGLEDVAVPTSDQILQRSGEIAGLVDQLIATLHEEDDAQPISELRFDAPHESRETAQPKKSSVGEPSNTSPTSSPENGEIRTLGESNSLQLRFDQIDISERFSQPLYQPHQRTDAEDLKITVREEGKSTTRQQLELQIDRRESADVPKVFSSSVPLPAATAKTATGNSSACNEAAKTENRSDEKTTESLIHVVQRGHDEALRHLLHHLREIEERVRE